MVKQQLYIIMPVKDSIEMAERAIQAIADSGYTLCIYDDNSTPENAKKLDELAEKLNMEIVHISSLTSHPSPNYRLVLQLSREKALKQKKHLVIVESDVIVQEDTLDRMVREVEVGVGMVAAVTTDERGVYNFPYHYLLECKYRHLPKTTISTRKRFSFCCTLLSVEFLQQADFEMLDPTRNWYDVTISHWSLNLGLRNMLMLDNPVLHFPHASRPWKQLKYTHPWLYYWRKFTQRLDKI